MLKKIIILILLIIALVVVIYVSKFISIQKPEDIIIDEGDPFSAPDIELSTTSTNTDAESPRLIGSGIETYNLKGYYYPYESKFYPLDYDSDRDVEYPKIFQCKGFLVTEGDKEFIDAYKREIKSKKVINDQIVLNLNHMILTPDPNYPIPHIPQKISSSTINNQIEINVKVSPFPERGVLPCDSYGLYIAESAI